MSSSDRRSALESLSYRQLQAFAKQANIKANRATADLVQLLEHDGTLSMESLSLAVQATSTPSDTPGAAGRSRRLLTSIRATPQSKADAKTPTKRAESGASPEESRRRSRRSGTFDTTDGERAAGTPHIDIVDGAEAARTPKATAAGGRGGKGLSPPPDSAMRRATEQMERRYAEFMATRNGTGAGVREEEAGDDDETDDGDNDAGDTQQQGPRIAKPVARAAKSPTKKTAIAGVKRPVFKAAAYRRSAVARQHDRQFDMMPTLEEHVKNRSRRHEALTKAAGGRLAKLATPKDDKAGRPAKFRQIQGGSGESVGAAAPGGGDKDIARKPTASALPVARNTRSSTSAAAAAAQHGFKFSAQSVPAGGGCFAFGTGGRDDGNAGAVFTFGAKAAPTVAEPLIKTAPKLSLKDRFKQKGGGRQAQQQSSRPQRRRALASRNAPPQAQSQPQYVDTTRMSDRELADYRAMGNPVGADVWRKARRDRDVMARRGL